MPKISEGEQNVHFCITYSCKCINSFYYCTRAQNKLKLPCCINSEDWFRERSWNAQHCIPSLFNLTASYIGNLTLWPFSGNMVFFFLCTLCQIHHSSHINVVLTNCGTNSCFWTASNGIPNIIWCERYSNLYEDTKNLLLIYSVLIGYSLIMGVKCLNLFRNKQKNTAGAADENIACISYVIAESQDVDSVYKWSVMQSSEKEDY